MPPKDQTLIPLGRAVRELRSERKLTQEELAHRISLTVGQLSKIERGLVSPRWATVTRIAEGLGLKPVELAERIEAAQRKTDGDRAG
jgi:transcriptional regulator with XRE-family HTH domain